MSEQRPKPGKAIDLLAAADKLPEKHRKISAMIRSASHAHSIRSDLDTAFDMLGSLDYVVSVAKEMNQERSWASDAALALINTVVVLYARATKTSSRHRGSINFKAHFTETEQERHLRICKLRDDAIAHFGPGDQYGGPPWQTEAVFLPVDRPTDLKIMTGSRRIIEQKQLQAMLKLQVHRALMLAEKETQKRISALTEVLNQNVEDDDLRNLLWEFEVDLVEFFESEAERDRVMEGAREGRHSGYVEH